MDHNFATQNNAAEQYLLGEMTAPERDAFEEHYFTCPECADAVRTGGHFVANARAAVREAAARPTVSGGVIEMKARPRPSLWQRLAPAGSIAAAVLLAVVGYQNMVQIPALLAPRILTPTVLKPISRSSDAGENVIAIKPGQKTIALDMDVNSDQPYRYDQVEVENQAGKPIFAIVGEAPAYGALEVELPTSKLPPGHYTLLVRGQTETSGQPGPVVGRSSFVVKE